MGPTTSIDGRIFGLPVAAYLGLNTGWPVVFLACSLSRILHPRKRRLAHRGNLSNVGWAWLATINSTLELTSPWLVH